MLGAEGSYLLVAVNRCRKAIPMVVFDGQDRKLFCERVLAYKTAAVFHARELRQACFPYPIRLRSGNCCPKARRWINIICQATELGTTTILPIVSKRTQVYFEAGSTDKKIDKWSTFFDRGSQTVCQPMVARGRASAIVRQFSHGSGVRRSKNGGQTPFRSEIAEDDRRQLPRYRPQCFRCTTSRGLSGWRATFRHQKMAACLALRLPTGNVRSARVAL